MKIILAIDNWMKARTSCIGEWTSRMRLSSMLGSAKAYYKFNNAIFFIKKSELGNQNYYGLIASWWWLLCYSMNSRFLNYVTDAETSKVSELRMYSIMKDDKERANCLLDQLLETIFQDWIDQSCNISNR